MSKQKNIFTALASFTRRERRGILVLLPLLVVVGAVIVFASRPRFEKTLPALVNATLRVEQRQEQQQPESVVGELFVFDPNTVDYMGLRRLGFSKRDAAGVLKYRDSYGKVFAIPSDFAACYQVSDSMFAVLEPYVNIGSQFRTVPRTAYKPREYTPYTPRRDSLWRGTAERSVVVANVVKKAEPVEINSADSVTLVAVRGLGGLTVSRILAFRSALGGFYRVEQLAEVAGVSEKNFELFVKEIYVDISKIQKIDVNFATPKQMEQHPYMSATMRRKLLKNRQLKGGWRSITEMIDDNILTELEAQKLSHYLSFGTYEPAKTKFNE